MRYGVLGPVEVRDGDRLVKIGGPQQQRLLAVLVSQPGQVISTARLIEVLWGDDDAPDAAAHSVLTYVHRLRGALGDGSIVTRGAGYLFEPSAGELDVQMFGALVAEARRAGPDAAISCYERALALWRGRAFGTFGDEWWAVPVAARLDEQRVVAAEERGACMIATGDAARAVPELQALVGEYPLRERPVGLLAQALHATGRQAEALREFQMLRERLVEESGLDPSDDAVELERAIARGDAGSGPSGGRPLRGYVIHEAIGEGAFGRVYSATQPGTNRRVAIKVIRPELADSEAFVSRFEAEAQLVARMEHPHVVPLYDYWREPGGAYLVFRLLKRSASAALVTGGPWSLERVSQLVEQVGGALLAAHAAGVEHRDVRTANVLLDEAGNTYLTDFGIAVADDDARDPAERVDGDIRDFAAMVWELLTGVAPSQPDSRRAARGADVRRPLPSVAGRVAGSPDSVDAVLADATDPVGGFDSMAEFILAWRAAVGRPEGVATPLGYASVVDSPRRLAARQLVAAAAAGINPYRGLRPFAEADALHYFGRDEVIDALVAAVERQRFVAVVGPSGSGKSSVVHAGVVPRLRRDSTRVVASMVPGERPLAALRDALIEVAVEPVRRRAPRAAIAAVAASAPDGLVLIVDQFEECWTLAPEAEREEFLTALAGAAESDGPTVRVVVAVRADFYDRPLQDPRIGRFVTTGTFPLPPLTPAELDDAVVLPAARAGVEFDDGVAAALVVDTASHPGALPMLQFTLAELYERRVDGRISAASLDALGGIAGAVARRAEDVYEGFDDANRSNVRDLFARLVTPGEGGTDTRRRARLGELSEGARAAADRFVAARLLMSDRDPDTREPVIEIAHEALISNWPRLQGWVDEDRLWLERLQHLAASARSWEAAGRPESELYRGSRLEAAIEALPVHGASLSGAEVAFVEAGRVTRDATLERERRSGRRLRRLLVAVVAVLVVALIAGSVAVVQRARSRDAARAARASEGRAISSERDAEIQALVGRIGSLRSTQRDAAALLSIEAFALADTPRSRSALLSTFTHDPGYVDTHHLPPDNDLYFGIVLPDGRHALVTTRDHQIRTYDLDTGRLGSPWAAMSPKELRFSVLNASPDGRLVAQIADNFGRTGIAAVTVGVFDATTGRLRFPAIEVPVSIGNSTFSPDGRVLVVSGGKNETVIAYDTMTGRELGRTTGPHAGNPVDMWSTAGVAFVGARRLAIGSVGGPVRIVDVPAMNTVREIALPANTSTRLFATGDGHTVVGGGTSGFVRFDATTGTRTWFVPNPSGSFFLEAVIGARGRFYVDDVYGRLVERDLADGHVTRQFDAQKGASGSLWPARNGTELVEFGNTEPVVTRWRVDGSGPITRRLPAGSVPYAYSPDGSKLAALVAPVDPLSFTPPAAQAVVLDAATGKVVDRLDGMVSPTWTDNHTIRGATLGSGGYTGVTYDLDTSSIVVRGSTLAATDLHGALDVGGSRLWVFYTHGDKGEVRTFDTATGKRVAPTIATEPEVAAAATRDGTRLAVAGHDITVHDTQSGKVVGRIPGRNLAGVHITRTGVLVVWSVGGELTMYDLATLAPLRTLPGSRGYLQDVRSDARGAMMATVGGDRSVAIYDIATGVEVGDPIDIADDQINAIALRPDGLELAVGGSRTAGPQVWDLDPHHWIDAACRVAGRNLTHAEWDSNIGSLRPYRRTCPQFPAGA